MPFFFTLLFLATAYITPGLLFGPLAPFHVELIIAFLAIFASVPGIARSGVARLPQTYAVLALSVIVVVSVAVHWLGGVPAVCYDFLPVMAAFFLTAINCRKPWHLKAIVFCLFLGSMFFIARGAYDLHNNIIPSNYLYTQEAVPRLRGLGVVNDPNDLAQVLVSLIPLIFLWRVRSKIVNLVLVGVPIAILITGMFLTHSRGSSIALMAVVAVAFRRKIGTVPAVILAGLLLVGVLAAGWGAGRDVSLESGADRLDAWALGIYFIKHNPILGIGYQQFKELNYITAHNSVVVCAAEIGIPGFLCWVLLLFSSFRFTLKLATPEEARAEEPSPSAAALPTGFAPPGFTPAVAGAAAHPQQFWAARRMAASQAAADVPAGPPATMAVLVPDDVPRIPEQELRRMAVLLMVAMTGFLTAGWFLSRAHSIWLFMYCGMACALVRMARDNGIEIPRDRAAYLLRWSAVIGFALLIVVYLLLRVRNVVGH